MIVCHCVGATDTAIRTVIEEGATTLQEVVERSGAGRCCEPCRDEITEMLGRRGPAQCSARLVAAPAGGPALPDAVGI